MNKQYQAILNVHNCFCKNKNQSLNSIAKELNLNWRTVKECYTLLNKLGLA